MQFLRILSFPLYVVIGDDHDPWKRVAGQSSGKVCYNYVLDAVQRLHTRGTKLLVRIDRQLDKPSTHSQTNKQAGSARYI